MGRIVGLFLLLAATARADEIDDAMRRAQMVMEPEHILADVVEKLDERLDADPRDVKSWRTLARALDMGVGVKARHAAGSLEARRHAHELDPDDCHLAALFARGEVAGGKTATVDAWRARDKSCAEMIYVQSRADQANELALLERSRGLAPSMEALVALGLVHLRRNELAAAAEAYRGALAAAPLFPEDWRMDGWGQVHAHLGLALVYAKQHQPGKARSERRALHKYWDDPGPWHDLSDEEKSLARTILHERLD